jgi:hypothetical protein
VGLSIAFFQEAVPLIDAPWTIAANLGFVYPETRGERPPDSEGTIKFGLALNRIAARDPTVHKLTLEVQHVLKPRSALFTPELVDRVQAEMAVLMIGAFAMLIPGSHSRLRASQQLLDGQSDGHGSAYWRASIGIGTPSRIVSSSGTTIAHADRALQW